MSTTTYPVDTEHCRSVNWIGVRDIRIPNSGVLRVNETEQLAQWLEAESEGFSNLTGHEESVKRFAKAAATLRRLDKEVSQNIKNHVAHAQDLNRQIAGLKAQIERLRTLPHAEDCKGRPERFGRCGVCGYHEGMNSLGEPHPFHQPDKFIMYDGIKAHRFKPSECNCPLSEVD